MARYQKLDRDELLDAAEALILKEGPHSLSIGAVAKEAGVSKGGIQSNFGTRDNLIEALFDRWGDVLEQHIEETKAQEDCPQDPLDIFIRASTRSHFGNPRQEAAMMYLLTGDQEKQERSQKWVRDKAAEFDLDGPNGRQRRLKFVVSQALSAVASLGMMPFSKEEWREIFADADMATSLIETDEIS